MENSRLYATKNNKKKILLCIDINFSNNNNESNATQGIIKQIVKFNNNNNSLNKTMHLHCGLVAFKVKRKDLQIISEFCNKNNDIRDLVPNLQGNDFNFLISSYFINPSTYLIMSSG